MSKIASNLLMMAGGYLLGMLTILFSHWYLPIQYVTVINNTGQNVQNLQIHAYSPDAGNILIKPRKVLNPSEKTVFPVIILGDTDVSVQGSFEDGSLTNEANDYSVYDPVLILKK